MLKISLTDFVDFTIKSGSPKLTKVRQIKERPPYEPAFDFYRDLRLKIIEFHKNGEKDKTILDDFANDISDKRKIRRYRDIVRGYKKFLGRKEIEWFDPPSGEWGPEDIKIAINPELGLLIGNIRHIIKLYFKADQLDKRRIDMINLLMCEAFNIQQENELFCGVLDVQRGRLFPTDEPDKALLPLLYGEAESFRAIYERL